MASATTSAYPRLLTGSEVGRLLGVDIHTVNRYARKGKLTSIRTPGGHRRYSETEVLALRALADLPARFPGWRFWRTDDGTCHAMSAGRQAHLTAADPDGIAAAVAGHIAALKDAGQ